jgi:hypothetical protein
MKAVNFTEVAVDDIDLNASHRIALIHQLKKFTKALGLALAAEGVRRCEASAASRLTIEGGQHVE